jgi:hypothetical protein
MSDDRGSSSREDIVAVDVIEVMVGVDHEPDGKLRDPPNLREELPGGFGILKRVDDRDPFVSHHESGVTDRPAVVRRDGGPDSLADFVESEVWPAGKGGSRRDQQQYS